MSEEVWKVIDGTEGYEISTNGRVRNIITNNFLKPGAHTKGYANITLKIDGVKKTKSIHRLMGIAFLSIKKDQQINHINGVKNDNRLTNLEVCTASENQLHRCHVLKKANSHGRLVKYHNEILELSRQGFSYGMLAYMYSAPRGSIASIVKKSVAAKALKAFESRGK